MTIKKLVHSEKTKRGGGDVDGGSSNFSFYLSSNYCGFSKKLSGVVETVLSWKSEFEYRSLSHLVTRMKPKHKV